MVTDVSGSDDVIGIIGGTGALGRGLAGRLAAAGVDVHLGSRQASRAEAAAGVLRERMGDPYGVGAIVGGSNGAVAAAADLLILAVPLAGLQAALAELEGLLDGRTLVSAVNPLGFDQQGPHLTPVPGGSVAGSIAEAVPAATVVAAFHTVSSRELARLEHPMDDDVPIAGDDERACARVAALADRIEGCRGVVVGPLRLAESLEALIPVLIGVNRRASAHVGVRFSRLPAPAG